MNPFSSIPFPFSVKAPTHKLSIEERWENLLKKTYEIIKQKHWDEENAEEVMPPYRGELYSKVNVYLSEVDWTINHIVRAFNLPTAYNAPGQEDIQFEEGKKKIPIDPKVTDVSGYTLQQLEDVVNGWMYFLNGVLKGLKEMVSVFDLIIILYIFLKKIISNDSSGSLIL